MTRKAAGRRLLLRCFLCGIAFTGAFLFDIESQSISPRSAFAEDTAALSQLAQLTVKKGFKNIGLGQVCDRLRIGGACKAYQINATVDPAESQKFGLQTGWQTSLNVLPQPSDAAVVVITEHDEHIGYAYLVGTDGGLLAVIIGLSPAADGKWRWKPGPATDDITRKFALEKAYWLAQIKAIEALPDRKN
jgi:hypothetical protein